MGKKGMASVREEEISHFSIVLSDPFSGSDRDYRRPVQWDVTLDRAKKCTRPIDLFIVEHARAPRATLLFRVF